ncbi:MAG: mechanosensitive ion channel domain-containing protein [Methylococcaceae bacterium]
MHDTLKNHRILSGCLDIKPNCFKINRVLLSLLWLLMLSPVSVSATPTSTLLNGILQQSTGKRVSAPAVIDSAALIEDINNKLAATSDQLALMPPEVISGSSTSRLPEDEDIFARRLNLKQLVFIYKGQLARLASLQILHQQRLELEYQTANWSGFSESSSHPFLRADELKATITRLGSRIDELKSWLLTLDQVDIQIINIVENSTVKLRQADEAVEQAKKSPTQQASLGRNRDLLILQNQMDLARALGFQIERQAVHEELLETQAKLQLANKQLSVLSERIELTQQDIDQVQENIESESRQIIAELKLGAAALDIGSNVDQQKRSASSPTAKTPQPESTKPGQIDQVREAQRNTADIKLQVLNRIMVYLQMQGDIWNYRWAYAKVTDREKAGDVYGKIIQNQGILKAVHDYVNQQRHRVLTHITSQSVEELDSTLTGPDTIRDELRNLDLEQVVLWSRLLGAIEATENLLGRCKQELDERFRVKSFSDYLTEAWLETRDFASQIWAFELFAAEDTLVVDGQPISGKRSITVDKVVTALAILVVGYWVAVRLARIIEGMAVTRLGMDASLARIAWRWILFIEVLLLVVLSMLVVRIPLTIFAFMGGALAIGVGFGMQNMLKNLISGLMLLFERPFMPGDVVEVGGIRGRVLDIGVRSSHIIDGNGIETVIPNSTFIEQNVTNWTLSSRSVRIVVNVGIAYGSPVKKATDLLLDIAEQHGLTLANPAPQVLFEDFGSDALLFGLYVWVEIKPEVSWKTIASDLRYMIYKTMTEQGIVIAFPQRDIHIDTNSPLEVRVLAEAHDTGRLKK